MSGENGTWRRSCGCMRTSAKLKQILKEFPEPPPPTPRVPSETTPPTAVVGRQFTVVNSAEVNHGLVQSYPIPTMLINDLSDNTYKMEKHLKHGFLSKKSSCKTWHYAEEIMSLLHMAVVGTALALYYIIYCYMQLIYFTLRSAVYFHQADGPMKITIAIVTVTSLIVSYQIMMRTEKLLGFTK